MITVAWVGEYTTHCLQPMDTWMRGRMQTEIADVVR